MHINLYANLADVIERFALGYAQVGSGVAGGRLYTQGIYKRNNPPEDPPLIREVPRRRIVEGTKDGSPFYAVWCRIVFEYDTGPSFKVKKKTVGRALVVLSDNTALTVKDVKQWITDYCQGEWCFTGQAFHFELEADAVGTRMLLH